MAVELKTTEEEVRKEMKDETAVVISLDSLVAERAHTTLVVGGCQGEGSSG